MSPLARNALIAFGITVLILGTIFYAVNYINNLRVSELNGIQDQIAVNTLSLETQFSLLESAPCSEAGNTEITSQLDDLGQRLSYTEKQLGTDDEQVVQLRKQYSLLEIRDYLLTKRIAATCGTKPVIVLYFYSNKGDCPKCDSAGQALTYLRETYPQLRVYSFDYDLDLGAVKTFISINKLHENLPAFVVNGKAFYGVGDLKGIEAILPMKSLTAATSTASTTTNK
jgi:hypothetical protein